MSDNFEESVDKFDSGELTTMDGEGKFIHRIEKAAQTSGERTLRNDLSQIYQKHKKENTNRKWSIGIAASVIVIMGSYYSFRGDASGLTRQPLRSDPAPIYLDSANYLDTLQIDSTNNHVTFETKK